MSHEKTPPPNQVVHLSAGAHAVINGALVSSREACTLEVGAGAYVLTGRALWPAHSAPRNPCDELYFSLLDCVADEERFFTERFRLFALLGEVAAQGALYERHRECSRCAAALMAGDPKAAVQSAARMASSRMEAESHSALAPGQFRDRRRASPSGI